MTGRIITLFLTYGGAAAGLFNPFLGLVAYVCLAILRPEHLWFWAVQPGNYSRTVAIAMLLGWAFSGFGTWKLGRAAAPVGAFTAFFLWSIIVAAQLTRTLHGRSSRNSPRSSCRSSLGRQSSTQ